MTRAIYRRWRRRLAVPHWLLAYRRRVVSRQRLAAGRWTRSRRLRALVMVTMIAFAVVAISGVDLADSDPPRLPGATVTLAPTVGPIPVSRSYFGLSTEYWALPLYARHVALLERVLKLLHVSGDGPMILRVGGDSADHSFWNPRLRTLPEWAFSLTPQWTDLTAGLVRHLGLRLILDLNLVTDSPQTAAAWAGAAEARLPRHSIIGFEIGNEPDIYSRTTWMGITSGDLVDDRSLPLTLTPESYLGDFDAYSAALRDVVPGVKLLGPALAYPRTHQRWMQALLAARPPNLSTISVHRYPYSACLPRRSSSFPTVARLLSDHGSTDLAAQLAPMIAQAHRAGLCFRSPSSTR